MKLPFALKLAFPVEDVKLHPPVPIFFLEFESRGVLVNLGLSKPFRSGVPSSITKEGLAVLGLFPILYVLKICSNSSSLKVLFAKVANCYLLFCLSLEPFLSFLRSELLVLFLRELLNAIGLVEVLLLSQILGEQLSRNELFKEDFSSSLSKFCRLQLVCV